MRVEMFDEAKSALQRAVELRPKDPSYLLALGIAWLRKTDLFEAEKLFRRVLQIEPGNAQGQLHLGYLLLNEKKFDEARLWLEKSVRAGVDTPEVFYYLGLVAQEQNDSRARDNVFEKAVQKLPTYVHARVALGSSYMRLKDYTRARRELETAVKLDPNEPTAHYNLALLYARTKEPAKAQEQMRIVETLKTGRRSTRSSRRIATQLNSELASDSHFQNNLRILCNLWITSGVVLCAIRHFLLRMATQLRHARHTLRRQQSMCRLSSARGGTIKHADGPGFGSGS